MSGIVKDVFPHNGYWLLWLVLVSLWYIMKVVLEKMKVAVADEYNNQLQRSIYLCHNRKMLQIWQVNTL